MLLNRTLFLIFVVFLGLSITACSSKKGALKENGASESLKVVKNPLGPTLADKFGGRDNEDPLGLGEKPTPPINTATNNTTNPMPLENPLSKDLQNSAQNAKIPPLRFPSQPNLPNAKLQTQTLPLTNPSTFGPAFSTPFNSKPKLSNIPPTSPQNNANAANNALNNLNLQGIPPDFFDRTSDFLVLMAPNGVVITIWATAPGNWLWGYSIKNSNDLGGYRIWRFILLPNDEVMIANFATRTTCMNTYKNGIIHSPCDMSNVYQRFTLRPMTNGAVQIYNKATDSCIQTPQGDVINGTDFGAINLTKRCSDSIDEQWYILPPPQSSALFE